MAGSENQSFLFDTDPEPVATVPGYPSVFSADRVYRYCLWRIWRNIAAPKFCMFLMLNPSTADDDSLDPTLRRCQDFAQAWDMDGMAICNLFAFRSTDPEAMKAADDPCGEDNDLWIARIAGDATTIICGWGVHGSHQRRDDAVRVLFNSIGKELHCLGTNKDGSCKHPLYTPANTLLEKYNLNRKSPQSEEEA